MTYFRHPTQVVRADWVQLTARILIAEEAADAEAQRRYSPWSLFWRLRPGQRRQVATAAGINPRRPRA